MVERSIESFLLFLAMSVCPLLGVRGGPGARSVPWDDVSENTSVCRPPRPGAVEIRHIVLEFACRDSRHQGPHVAPSWVLMSCWSWMRKGSLHSTSRAISPGP